MYRLRPNLGIKSEVQLTEGFENVFSLITEERKKGARKFAIEVYPGVNKEVWKNQIAKVFSDAAVIDTDELFVSSQRIFAELQNDLTSDDVFGRFSHRNFEEFFSYEKIRKMKEKHKDAAEIFVIGVGASDVFSPDLLIYADITRWEIQLRFKKSLGNWMGYKENSFSEKLKRAYYFEWPAADARKEALLEKCDYYADMTKDENPKFISVPDLQKILKEFTQQPFRLVPYFDPGVWGGFWLQEKFDADKEKVNLAWSFDGVPEENSILADVNGTEIEMPAQNLVMMFSKELLGNRVLGRFGKDFPIRFDYLDTMGGQNLSLQVHPTFDYAYRNFGAKYTQDESYYILDCKEDAHVYLGVKNGVKKEELVEALEEAQRTGKFDDEKFINSIPAKKHDHFLIPGGTIHSAGENCVVLEISSTPNRFTFKLWDWGRLDLDGKPRPISIQHGKQVINSAFDEDFAESQLYNATAIIQQSSDLLEERTGLHELEAIETRRLTFSKEIGQSTDGSVNMLNLVEGNHIRVLSPEKDFEPFDVYYGETFIIPESVKEYGLVSADGSEVKVMKAYIR